MATLLATAGEQVSVTPVLLQVGEVNTVNEQFDHGRVGHRSYSSRRCPQRYMHGRANVDQRLIRPQRGG